MNILLAIFSVSIIGVFFPKSLVYIAAISFILIVIYTFKSKNISNILKKIKNNQKRADKKRFKNIKKQFNYIDKEWGFNQTQAKVVDRFLEERAYSIIYRKLSFSILPQLIELIESCNKKDKLGCKREVNRRINELILILKEAIKESRELTHQNYEISLEVVDRLLKELKR